MGIPGVYKQIGAGERIAISKLAVEHLERTGRPLRIAIDISIWHFQIQCGQGGKNPALRTLYYRLLRLLGLSIQPLFVFDGPCRPAFKRNVRIQPNAECLPNFLTKELLKRFGFLYHTAPGEAEAECAYFQKAGIVDAVLSEDVDTMMFGCSMSLRNWTAEGTRGNKAPTHVNVFTREATKNGSAGLDSDGMILIALMSGGDYITAGIPGCGPKTAGEAARAGFGRDLCRISPNDDAGLKVWSERLGHELRSNESRFFRQKHKAIRIPEDFPDKVVLGYYTHPVVSPSEKVAKLREELKWNPEIDILELRKFVAEAFNWLYYTGARHFIRGLAPVLLARRLWETSMSDSRDDTNIEDKEAREGKLIKTISGRRAHWETDGAPELRISYIPAEIVGLDLEAEGRDPLDCNLDEGSNNDQPDSDRQSRDRAESPTKRHRPNTYNPTQVEKTWVLETYVKLGVPLLVETWEEEMSNPKKFISRKAREKTALSKGGMRRGAMERYVKTGKAGVERHGSSQGEPKISESHAFSPAFLAPDIAVARGSPQRKALSENRNPVGKKATSEETAKAKAKACKTKTRKKSIDEAASPIRPQDSNPWTLAKRPSDTYGIKSPTRYSALGIYPPDNLEYHEPSPRCPNSKNSSPPTPTKKHRHPPSDPEQPTLSTHQPNLSSPHRHDISNPSPKKKQSPLHIAPATTHSQPPSTKQPAPHLRDQHSENPDSEPPKSQKSHQSTVKKTSPTPPSSDSDSEESLLSPSTLLSPRPLRRVGSNAVVGDPPSAAEELDRSWEKEKEKKEKKRFVAVRESLEGAWKHLESWEVAGSFSTMVYSEVELVDLTGS